MGESKVYMLQRDRNESIRLEEQSSFLHALFHRRLLHSSIPRDTLHAVADVGTGTGVWMRELQQELDSEPGNRSVQFVGFDSCDDQFPLQRPSNHEYLVHDAVRPFPPEYHHRFDLVHLRFLSYGIKAHQLADFVDSVSQIIRPGGYLQWQEIDGIDAWSPSPTLAFQQLVSWIIAERIARGLTPAITGLLIKTLQSRSTRMSQGLISPMSWTDDLFRIYQIETVSTYHHPSSEVRQFNAQWQTTVLVQLLQSGAARRSALANEPGTASAVSERLEQEILAIEDFVRKAKSGELTSNGGIEVSVTRIVARKAMLFSKDDLWMAQWHNEVAANTS